MNANRMTEDPRERSCSVVRHAIGPDCVCLCDGRETAAHAQDLYRCAPLCGLRWNSRTFHRIEQALPHLLYRADSPEGGLVK